MLMGVTISHWHCKKALANGAFAPLNGLSISVKKGFNQGELIHELLVVRILSETCHGKGLAPLLGRAAVFSSHVGTFGRRTLPGAANAAGFEQRATVVRTVHLAIFAPASLKVST